MASVGRKKGTPKTGGGSRKGIPNKVTKELKEMILGALSDVGGQKYLARQAEENPASFMTLIGKLVPAEIKNELTGKDGSPLIQPAKTRAEIEEELIAAGFDPAKVALEE